MKKLTPTQRRALLHAYSPDFCLYGSDEPGFGFATRTVRALHQRALVVEDGDEWAATDDAAGALGVDRLAADNVLSAVDVAARHFLGRRAPKAEPEANRTFFTLSEEVRDFGDALAVLDLGEVDGTDDDDLLWSCVGRAVSEMGFPCDAEFSGDVVSFWAAE